MADKWSLCHHPHLQVRWCPTEDLLDLGLYAILPAELRELVDPAGGSW